MANFYFTYGTEGQPFVGGWTMVVAESFNAACEKFREVHPDNTNGLLNCAGVYSEEYFSTTPMATKGNLGAFCHEVIENKAGSAYSWP